MALIDVATKKGDLEMARSYWNTYHCQSQIVKADGKLYGNYCKNRFCTLCAGMVIQESTYFKTQNRTSRCDRNTLPHEKILRSMTALYDYFATINCPDSLNPFETMR
jgi:hypothetical protein